jgi:hypothetical protein
MGAGEVGKLLDMSPRTVLLKAQRREIGCVRDGRLVKFRAHHVAEYQDAHEQSAIPAQVPARPKR